MHFIYKILNKKIGFILLVSGVISCAGVTSGLATVFGKDAFKYLQHLKKSPFNEMPEESVGDIDFFTDFYGFWKDGLYFIEMFYSFNPRELVFLKRDGKLTSEYSISVECYDNEGDISFQKLWDESFTASDYNSTRVDWAIVKKKVFPLEPGEYKIVSNFKDKNSKITAKVERSRVIIPPLNDSDLTISDIGFAEYQDNLFDSYELNSLENDYSNINHANRLFKDTLQIYYEIYNHSGPLNVEYSIFNQGGEQILPDSLRIDSVEGSKTAGFDISLFSEGYYIFSIKFDFDTVSTGINKEFRIFSIRLDLGKNFKDTIRLITYYIDYDAGALKNLKKSKSGSERLEAWQEFWKSFDQVPNTDQNEYLDEFSNRIHFADLHFGSQIRKGSFTPMGQVYICLGPPDDVYFRQMPQETNSYEIWEYFRTFASTPARTFYFFDVNGLDIKGEYRLVNEADSPRWFEQ